MRSHAATLLLPVATLAGALTSAGCPPCPGPAIATTTVYAPPQTVTVSFTAEPSTVTVRPTAKPVTVTVTAVGQNDDGDHPHHPGHGHGHDPTVPWGQANVQTIVRTIQINPSNGGPQTITYTAPGEGGTGVFTTVISGPGGGGGRIVETITAPAAPVITETVTGPGGQREVVTVTVPDHHDQPPPQVITRTVTGPGGGHEVVVITTTAPSVLTTAVTLHDGGVRTITVTLPGDGYPVAPITTTTPAAYPMTTPSVVYVDEHGHHHHHCPFPGDRCTQLHVVTVDHTATATATELRTVTAEVTVSGHPTMIACLQETDVVTVTNTVYATVTARAQETMRFRGRAPRGVGSKQLR